MVAPLSSGPPPDTSRTGLPQVWPSRQEKVWTDMASAYAALHEALNLARGSCRRTTRFSLARNSHSQRESLAVATMGLEGPQQDRLTAEEGIARRSRGCRCPTAPPGSSRGAACGATGATSPATTAGRARPACRPAARRGRAPGRSCRPRSSRRRGSRARPDGGTARAARGCQSRPQNSASSSITRRPCLRRQPFGQRALSRSCGADDDDAPHPSNLARL